MVPKTGNTYFQFRMMHVVNKSIYCICDVQYICSIFFVMDVTVTKKNVMDATSLINFGKISI